MFFFGKVVCLGVKEFHSVQKICPPKNLWFAGNFNVFFTILCIFWDTLRYAILQQKMTKWKNENFFQNLKIDDKIPPNLQLFIKYFELFVLGNWLDEIMLRAVIGNLVYVWPKIPKCLIFKHDFELWSNFWQNFVFWLNFRLFLQNFDFWQRI